MKCFHVLIIFTCVKFFAQFSNAEPNEYALTLVQDENKLEFPPTSVKSNGEFNGYSAEYKGLFYLCPFEPQPALKIITTVTGQYFGPAKKLCNEPVEPTIFKVEGELENDNRKNDLHLYHIGFLINDEKLKSIEKPTNYESMNENHHFMPMISVYQDKGLQYTVTVKYDVFTVDIQKKLKSSFAYTSSNLFVDKVQQLYRNQHSKLKTKLGDNYDKDMHKLVLDSLVNESDIIVDTWKKTAYFKVLQILVWKGSLETWKIIRKFVGYIFKFGISTKIRTAGVGKALTLSYSKGTDYKMEWGQGKETIFIPELYWIAVEYKSTRSDQVTGMFVIMHNLPGAGEKNIEKICDTNICITNGIWLPNDKYESMKHRVYCCPMDTTTIGKLKSKFLLHERDIFDGTKNVTFPMEL